jgi:DNA-binding transcriptional LysR family regulator
MTAPTAPSLASGMPLASPAAPVFALTPDALAMVDSIARTGSFAAAARELGKVPSALTYSVRQLEEALDVLLFDRSSRQAQLTAAGTELLLEGRRLLQEMAAVAHRVQRVASGWETQLTVVVDDIVSTTTVFDLVQAFCALRDAPAKPDKAVGAAKAGVANATNQSVAVAPQGPPTRIRLRTEVLAGTWEALASGQADLALGVSSDQHQASGFELRPLGEIAFVFCVAPHHPLAGATAPLGDDQLVHQRAVAVADSAQRLAPVTINLLPGQDVLTVPHMRAKVQALLLGLGCGFVPEPLARAHLKAGRLVQKSTTRAPYTARLHYAWRTDRGGLGQGKALQWWLAQLESPTTRQALVERHGVAY